MSSIRIPGRKYDKKMVRFEIQETTTPTDDDTQFPSSIEEEELKFTTDYDTEEAPGQHVPSFGWEPQTPRQIENLWREVADNGTGKIPIGYLWQLIESV